MRILLCVLAIGQAAQAQQYVFHVYRQAEGLRIWPSTRWPWTATGFSGWELRIGVYRFLGSGFERFGQEQGIAEIDIEDVVADPDGTIWIGTDQNFYHWDGRKFLSSGRDSARINAPWNMAVEDARHLLIVDNRRLYRLEHDAAGNTLSYLPVFSDAEAAWF